MKWKVLSASAAKRGCKLSKTNWLSSAQGPTSSSVRASHSLPCAHCECISVASSMFHHSEVCDKLGLLVEQISLHELIVRSYCVHGCVASAHRHSLHIPCGCTRSLLALQSHEGHSSS